nr:DUF4294 domain-containing protein [uncultured Capnocytophaga sp.]
MKTFFFAVLLSIAALPLSGKSVEKSTPETTSFRVGDTLTPAAQQRLQDLKEKIQERDKKIQEFRDRIESFKAEMREKKPYLKKLAKKAWKVYPYAQMAADRLLLMEQAMDTMKTIKEKERYVQQTQQYIESHFAEQLKNLTQSEGRILLKLIHRQTGHTSYQIVEELRNRWYAWTFEKVARLFHLSLSTPYDPLRDEEDFWTEIVVQMLEKKRKITPQKPALQFEIWRLYNEREKRY